MKNSHLKIVLWLLIPVGWIFGIYEWRVNSKLCDCNSVVKSYPAKEESIDTESNTLMPNKPHPLAVDTNSSFEGFVDVLYSDAKVRLVKRDKFFKKHPNFSPIKHIKKTAPRDLSSFDPEGYNRD